MIVVMVVVVVVLVVVVVIVVVVVNDVSCLGRSLHRFALKYSTSP